MSSEKGVKKELSDFAKDFGSQGSRNGKGTAVLPPKLGCPHPHPDMQRQDLYQEWFIMICVALWDMILFSSRVYVYMRILCILCILLTCMCSTELKALFDPASGREPSL